MSKNIDIQIKEIERIQYHSIQKKLSNKDIKFNLGINSKLILEFKGKEINNIILNTLRRVAEADIPTYAISAKNIIITENTSIYNNDMIRANLCQLQILNTELDIYYLDQEYWKDVDYSDKNRVKHKSEKSIELYINVNNNGYELLNVTTNDIKYYEDTNLIENKYDKKCPLLLNQLRPGEKFNCSMKGSLGVGYNNSIWSSIAGFYFDDGTTDDLSGKIIENKDGKLIFGIESLGQFDEYQILTKCCYYIDYKLDQIENILKEKEKEINEKTLEIIFDDEDHTIGYLINNAFQDHKDIKYSGMARPDRLVKSIIIKISCQDNIKTPFPAIFEQIKYLKNVFSFMKNTFENK
jgi:DNA-directed RNA polymerase subunit L